MTLEKESRKLYFENKVEVRSSEEGKKYIEGYAIKWNQLSQLMHGWFKERFLKGAFTESLASQEVIATWQHNWEEVLGRTPKTLELWEDEIGLKYRIDPPSHASNRIESIERGDVIGSSFTFAPEIVEWNDEDEISIRTIMKAIIYEIAPVVNPAYLSSTSMVSKRCNEEMLKEAGKLDFEKRNSKDKEIELLEKRLLVM